MTEWLDYDTHYTERYLGVPDLSTSEGRQAYEVSGLLERPYNGDGRLLLIHGTADDNVYFSHTLKLVDRLFRSGASVDKVHVLPVANLTHMVPEPLVMRRMWEQISSFLGKR